MPHDPGLAPCRAQGLIRRGAGPCHGPRALAPRPCALNSSIVRGATPAVTLATTNATPRGTLAHPLPMLSELAVVFATPSAPLRTLTSSTSTRWVFSPCEHRRSHARRQSKRPRGKSRLAGYRPCDHLLTGAGKLSPLRPPPALMGAPLCSPLILPASESGLAHSFGLHRRLVNFNSGKMRPNYRGRPQVVSAA